MTEKITKGLITQLIDLIDISLRMDQTPTFCIQGKAELLVLREVFEIVLRPAEGEPVPVGEVISYEGDLLDLAMIRWTGEQPEPGTKLYAAPAPSGEWVSVKERLPEGKDRVLAVWAEDNDVITCGAAYIRSFPEQVTYWMPKPAAPKEAR